MSTLVPTYLCYSIDGNGSTCVVIQREGTEQDGVADTKINELHPDTNYGSESLLHTTTAQAVMCGNVYTFMSLISFTFTLIPHDGPGTGTPGYWKNHPEAWPVDTIEIGGVTCTIDEAIGFMLAKKNNDKTHTMFGALVAAVLNVIIGNASGCIDDTIAAAHDWMAEWGPVGSGVEANSSAWQDVGEPLYLALDDYNNGLLCAPARD